MKERSFDEMVAYFNHRASEMDIAQGYKMELLGMVTALGYKHEKTAQRWIPCSDRLPRKGEQVLCSNKKGSVFTSAYTYTDSRGVAVFGQHLNVIAWMPLPEPYTEDNT